MKQIIILGGGYAGVAATHVLLKHQEKDNYHITLIDRNPYHLFTPSLYEVATSETPQGNIAIPLSEIFGNSVSLLKGTVESIDIRNKQIKLQNDNNDYKYDYLIFALGSKPAYYGIPGLEKYSIPLKSLEDAIRIKNSIATLSCKEDECNKKTQVVIGGGGFSGTEFAAELLTYEDKLSKQLRLAKDCLDITIIQGSPRLLKELDEHVSKIAEKRVNYPNMHLAFGGHIKEVTQNEVVVDNGNNYQYDILIWTGGVEANPIGKNAGLPFAKSGQLIVNDFLQVQDHPEIFAAGDIAGFLDTATQHSVPNVAQVAEDQGKVAGENVLLLIKNKLLKKYKYSHWGYVVPMRGRFAAAELMGFLHFDGFLGWILEQLIYLRYLLGILSLPKALMRWNKFEVELKQ